MVVVRQVVLVDPLVVYQGENLLSVHDFSI
jgi:hypothetical protein